MQVASLRLSPEALKINGPASRTHPCAVLSLREWTPPSAPGQRRGRVCPAARCGAGPAAGGCVCGPRERLSAGHAGTTSLTSRLYPPGMVAEGAAATLTHVTHSLSSEGQGTKVSGARSSRPRPGGVPDSPAALSFLAFCCPPDVVDRSSGTGMGSSLSSGASLTGGLSFPEETSRGLSSWGAVPGAPLGRGTGGPHEGAAAAPSGRFSAGTET